MQTRRLSLVLAFGLVAGAAWAGDGNPMDDVDDTLLLGKPTAASESSARTSNPESKADQAPMQTVDEDLTVIEVEASTDPYGDDAPVAPLSEVERDETIGSSLANYAFLPGDTLRRALERWARDAGYSVVWRADVDMNVDIEMTFPRGTDFEDAVEQTLGAFWRRGAELTGTLYRNRVLVVAERTKS